MTARRHHYVPQCYLKGFAADRDNPMLFVIDANRKYLFTTGPANVAAERDFHRVDAEGIEPDALENGFSAFEDDLSQALERIIAACSITNAKDWAYVINLMALMATKNPQHRETFREFHEELMKRVLDLATATPERWESQMRRAKADGAINADADGSYEQMRDFVVRDEFKVNVKTNFNLHLEVKAYETVLPFLARRGWMLLRALKGQTGFITSSHPICLMWSDRARRGQFHGPGHGMRNTQLIFPISNELCAVGAFELHHEERDVPQDQDRQDQCDDSIIFGPANLRARRQLRLSNGAQRQDHART